MVLENAIKRPTHDDAGGHPLLRKQYAEAGDRQCRTGELPFSLDPIGNLGRHQSSGRRGNRDDDGVGERFGEGDPLRDQQCRDPAGEPVIADRLHQLKDDQHGRAALIGRPENLPQRAGGLLDLAGQGLRRRQRAADFALDPGLDHAGDPVRICMAAVLGEPTRRFGKCRAAATRRRSRRGRR